MGRHLVIVLSNPVEGREGEFHDWYENTHLDEVLSTCGWKSAERFTLTGERGAGCGFSHLAAYEAEGEDAEAILDRLQSTRDLRRQSKAIDLRNAALWVFTPAGEVHRRPGHS